MTKNIFIRTLSFTMNPYFVLKQYVGDYIGCDRDPTILNSPEFLRKIAFEAIDIVNTKAVKFIEHSFKPQGYTLLIVLADSSLNLHSWPEEKFVTVEIFTCAERADPEAGLKYFAEKLKPKKFISKKIERD